MELNKFKKYFKKSLEVFEELYPDDKYKQIDFALEDLFTEIHRPVCSDCGVEISEDEIICINCNVYYCDDCGKPSDILICTDCSKKRFLKE